MNSLLVLIPLAPFLLVAFIFWTRHQGKLAELRAKAAGEAGAHDAQRLAELEQRVRVLERIVADGGYDTAIRIEALRDAPPTVHAREQRAIEDHV